MLDAVVVDETAVVNVVVCCDDDDDENVGIFEVAGVVVCLNVSNLFFIQSFSKYLQRDI